MFVATENSQTAPRREEHQIGLRWLLVRGLYALLFALCAWQIAFIWYELPLNLTHVTAMAVLTTLVAGAIFVARQDLSLLGFTGIYFLYTALANLGAVAAALFVENPFERFSLSSIRWFYSDLLPFSVALAGIAVATFTLSTILVTGRFQPSNKKLPTLAEQGDRSLLIIGLLLLISTALYLTFAVYTGTLPLFSSYHAYRDAMGDVSGYGWVIFAIAAGLAFVLATGNKVEVALGIGVFMIPATILLITGNRGEVLYPIAAGIAVIVKRGYRPNRRALYGFLVMFFFVIPVIRDIRSTSVLETSTSDLRVQIVDPFVELGFQMRPIVGTVEWIASGEDLAYGHTYLWPVRKQLSRIVPFDIVQEDQDERFVIRERLPSQGYSVVAESYFNFGLLGVIIVPMLYALFLIMLGEYSTSSSSLAVVGAIMAILINNVRNSFAFVPGQSAVVLLLFLLSLVIRMIFFPPKESQHQLQGANALHVQ